jgi:hypothetical protein
VESFDKILKFYRKLYFWRTIPFFYPFL